MNLELNDVQAAVPTSELHSIIQNDGIPSALAYDTEGDPRAATAGA